VSLQERQAAVVAALVAGAPAPPGFDTHRVRATATALLRKRTGEVAAAWPLLAAALGADWSASFGAWAAGRPPAGALRDGWDFARSLTASPAASPPLTMSPAGPPPPAASPAGLPPPAASPAGLPPPAAPPTGLPPLAAQELAEREVTWHYDGASAPRRRRGPALRRAGGTLFVQVAGRVWRLPP